MTQEHAHTGVTPHLTVSNAKAAIEFYKAAFGAEELGRQGTPDGSKLIHAAMLVNGAPLMLNDDFPEMNGGQASTPEALGGSPVTLHLSVPDVDAAFARATAAGATVLMPLEDMFWGDRYGIVRDPFGHQWSLATTKRAVSEEEMEQAVAEAFPVGR